MAEKLHIGSRVRVRRGRNWVDGKVVDVWNDPPEFIRVQLSLPDDAELGPVIVLLSPAMVEAA